MQFFLDKVENIVEKGKCWITTFSPVLTMFSRGSFLSHKNPWLFGKGFNRLPDDKILDWSKLEQIADNILTLSQTSPGFYVSAVQVFWKHCGKRRSCS